MRLDRCVHQSWLGKFEQSIVAIPLHWDLAISLIVLQIEVGADDARLPHLDHRAGLALPPALIYGLRNHD